FRRWERFMYLFMAFNIVVSRSRSPSTRIGCRWRTTWVVPGVQGGLDSTALLRIVAAVGPAVAPWQLFFQQSNVVGKRITQPWTNYEPWATDIANREAHARSRNACMASRRLPLP